LACVFSSYGLQTKNFNFCVRFRQAKSSKGLRNLGKTLVLTLGLVYELFVSRVAQYSVWLRAGRPGDRGSIPGKGQRIFPLISVSRPALGPTQPPVQWVPGVLSQGTKARPGRDADHSPPSSAEVRNW